MLLEKGLKKLGLDASEEKLAQYSAYLVELQKWNKTFNLTSITEMDQMIVLHLLDSLVLVPRLFSGISIADVGTGAGLPGIPLAIARSGIEVTLIESNQKKLLFLRHVKGLLALKNLHIVEQRVEQFQPQHPFDIVVSRAFSALPKFIEVTRHLISKQKGQFWAMKGTKPDEELKELPEDIALVDVYRLNVPFLEAQRHLVVCQYAAGDVS